MNKLLYCVGSVILLTLLTFLEHSCKHNSGPAEITLEDSVIDLGTYPSTEMRQFSYTFRNTGGEELFIENIIPDCSCIHLDFNSSVVLPGEKRTINVTYDARPEFHGELEHEICIYSNAHNGSKILTFKSNYP